MAKPAVAPLITLNDGKKIPVFGLGTWKSKPGEVREAVKFALLEAGYRHIDCAFVYGNEAEVGEALRDVLASGKLKREDIFITSKCWNTFHSRARVTECLKRTLANLGLDYLDLYLIHWPQGYKEGGDLFPSDGKDGLAFSDVDYLETWQGMEDVHRAGLTKSIGVSNFNSQQIDRLLANCSIKPVMNQFEVHPYLNQKDLIAHCKSRNVAVTAYSPLGSPDRPWAKPDDPSLLADPRVKAIAEKHNKSPAQVLLRFAVQRDIVVIPKSVTPSRIAENIQIFDFTLSEEEMNSIYSFNNGWRVCVLEKAIGHPQYPFSIPF